MRRIVAGLLAGLMLFTPTFQAVGDDIRIEVKGDLYDRLELPKGGEPGDLTLFQGQLGGGLTPPVGACGINAASSFIAGLSSIANLGGLQEFINNWQNAGTALALYALATYLPVAKEVLLGANMLSNFVAQLRGFSCSQAMEAIKEFNYQDSFLIKRCIAKRLGISAENVDVVRSTDPDRWYQAYRACLNSASLVDLFGGDRGEAERYLKFISPRSLARCYLGVNRAPTPEEIANADLETRVKYFLYMVLPDISMDSNGLLRVRTVEIVDTQTGQRRPATMLDVMNLHVETFVEDYKKLIEKLKSEIKFEMGQEEAWEASKRYFEEFERKYRISVRDMIPTMILLLRMRDYLQKNAERGPGNITYIADLHTIDNYIEETFMKVYLDEALRRLERELDEALLRLKQAEAMRRAVGSGAIPGDRDGCFGGSSGGST
jgi:hypothetical protein